MGALDALNEARNAAAAKSVNTGAFRELPSYTQQTGRDVPTTSYDPLSGMTGRKESSAATGKLDLTLPENAASARYQKQADKYFAHGGPGENIDIFTGAKKTVTTSGPTSEQTAAQ